MTDKLEDVWDTDRRFFIGTSGQFVYIIQKTELNVYCGYVGVPLTHILFARTYSSIPGYLKVHGGVTYSGPMDGIGDDFWFFGFDCAHYGDEVPGFKVGLGTGEYREFPYVLKETLSLIKQLRDPSLYLHFTPEA